MKIQSKEKPILFSTEMVKAILGGRKTMTRRTQGLEGLNNKPDDWEFLDLHPAQNSLFAVFNSKIDEDDQVLFKSKYKKDDILWVRETWQWEGDTNYKDIMPIGNFYYRANFEDDSNWNLPFKWKPSIHMPREAARIFLRVTNVRVERLNDISFKDAVSEGIEMIDKGDEGYKIYDYPKHMTGNTSYAPDSFKSLWNSINGEESWNKNPWVFVYEFERIKR